MTIYGGLEEFLTYQSKLRDLRRAARQQNTEALEKVVQEQTAPDVLGGILTDKVTALAGILSDIQKDMMLRMQVSERVSSDIDTQYCYLKTKFFAMYLWPVGVSGRATESRRGALEKLLNDLNKEKREEQVSCWQDVAKLREESRRWLKQYSDLKLRASLMVGQLAGGAPQAVRPREQS